MSNFSVTNIFDFRGIPLFLESGMVVRADLDGRGQWQIVGDGRPAMTLHLYGMSVIDVCAFLNQHAAQPAPAADASPVTGENNSSEHSGSRG